MLYGQLQEGLHLGILRSASVSGVMSYKELCMAAKNEEQRQAELKKRHNYSRSQSGFTNKGRYDDKSTKGKSFKPSQNSRMQIRGSSQTNSGSNGNSRYQQRCYLCNQLGHIEKYCKQSKSKETESSGGSSQVTTRPNENTVRVKYKGSKPQYVPTSGIIDTGADITIMGGELFKKVAAAARLKKRDFLSS